MPTVIVGLGGTGTLMVKSLLGTWASKGRPRDVAVAVIDAKSTPGINEQDVEVLRTVPVNFPLEHSNHARFISSWWPEGVQPTVDVQFTTGCGAVRTFGHFFSYFFSSEIEACLQAAVDDLTIKLPRTARRNDGFRAYLLGSLGNGTGGGSFMEVATILKNILANHSPAPPFCAAIFIPSSVTRKHVAGDTGLHIGINGYGSLVELQYEFNRATVEAVRPMRPHEFVGNAGARVYNPGGDSPQGRAASTIAPLDMAFVIDRLDRNGQRMEYPTLINLAAQAVAGFVDGVDADQRTLDTLVHATPGRRFASLGGVRLTVPATEIRDATALAQCVRALAAASDPSWDAWTDLLADASPGGRALRREDATLNSSIRFLLEEVLQILEVRDEEGTEHNQLFDRFEAHDDALLHELEEKTAGVEELSDPDDLVLKANQIVQFMDLKLRGLDSQRSAALLDGPSSLWLRAPRDPEKPVDAGVRWLLDRRVLAFVRAGAIGPLGAWLTELKVQVEKNRDSVAAYERRKWLSQPADKEIDVSASVAVLEKAADGIFAVFRKTVLREGVGKVQQDAGRKLRFLLWESKVVAVERFFDAVRDHVELLERAASGARATLTARRVSQQLKDELRKVSAVLDTNLQEEHTSEGLQAEFFLGGSEAMRNQILAELEASPDSSIRGLLAAVRKQNEGLFAYRLAGEAKKFSFPLEAPAAAGDPDEVADAYREALRAVVQERVKTVVQKSCNVDSVLETDARASLAGYYRDVIEEQDAVDQTARQEAIHRIADVVGRGGEMLVRDLPWMRSKAEALETGVDYLIAGQLARFLTFATPQWHVRTEIPGEPKLMRSYFLLYNGRAKRIPKALAAMGQLQAGVNVTAYRDDSFDAREVRISSVEANGHLDHFLMPEEREAYLKALKDKTYVPHTTRQYHEAAQRLVKTMDDARSGGVALAPLAELYGLLEHDSRGNYKLVQSIEAYSDAGKLVHPAVAPGLVGPRGLVAFNAFLTGTTADATTLRTALKRLVYQALRKEALGETGAPGVGWERIGLKVAGHAGSLVQEVRDEKDPSVRELVERQARELTELYPELQRLQGAEVPRLLA